MIHFGQTKVVQLLLLAFVSYDLLKLCVECIHSLILWNCQAILSSFGCNNKNITESKEYSIQVPETSLASPVLPKYSIELAKTPLGKISYGKVEIIPGTAIAGSSNPWNQVGDSGSNSSNHDIRQAHANQALNETEKQNDNDADNGDLPKISILCLFGISAHCDYERWLQIEKIYMNLLEKSTRRVFFYFYHWNYVPKPKLRLKGCRQMCKFLQNEDGQNYPSSNDPTRYSAFKCLLDIAAISRSIGKRQGTEFQQFDTIICSEESIALGAEYLVQFPNAARSLILIDPVVAKTLEPYHQHNQKETIVHRVLSDFIEKLYMKNHKMLATLQSHADLHANSRTVSFDSHKGALLEELSGKPFKYYCSQIQIPTLIMTSSRGLNLCMSLQTYFPNGKMHIFLRKSKFTLLEESEVCSLFISHAIAPRVK